MVKRVQEVDVKQEATRGSSTCVGRLGNLFNTLANLFLHLLYILTCLEAFWYRQTEYEPESLLFCCCLFSGFLAARSIMGMSYPSPKELTLARTDHKLLHFLFTPK